MRRVELRRALRRGFSMIELAVATAIIAITVAIAVPMLTRATPQQRLRDAASELVSNIRLARSMAVSGQTNATVGTVDAMEIQFNDAGDEYSLVALNLTTGTFAVVKRVRMVDYKGATIDLVPTIAPTPMVRFSKNGAADRIATIALTEMQLSMKKEIEITRAGLARIN